MVKFSQGMWHPMPGTVVDWATDCVKSEQFQDYIRWVTSSRPINHRGDILNNPTITFECSSPAEDILLLHAFHHRAHAPSNSGPQFELFPEGGKPTVSARQDHVETSKSDSELKISTNTISAIVDIRPKTFSVEFHSHLRNAQTGSLLTKLGWRSVGHVKRGHGSVHPTFSVHPHDMLTNPNNGERWLTLQFHLSVGERIYGLGERFGPFVRNGQSIEMWNQDGGTSSELAYKNVPFFLSSRGYGLFVACPGFVSYEVQSERTTRVNISVPYESLSVYLIHGPSPSKIIERYTFLTGRPALPPPWTFGLWLSTSFTTNYDENTVNTFLDGMKEREIPVNVFHFDCFWMKGFQWCDFEFDKEFFPDAEGQLQRLKEKGYKICVWINPYIAQESSLFNEGYENGYFIMKSDGSVWQFDAWQAGMAFVDFTNPAAWSWYQSKLKMLLDMGVDAFKTDFGERIPTGDAIYYDKSNAEKMHNYYSFLYNKCVFEVTERERGKNQAIVFARSATGGCQRFPVHWGGDPMSTYEAMAETLRGGLSLGLSGFAYWAHDIGGFEGKPDAGLYKRWFAFGSLSSHSRLHGSGSFRVPWIIDGSGEADKVLKHFARVKLSLLPYLYHTAISSHRNGTPMLRPVFIEFPEDPASWVLDTQYMLGPNLMIVPVFNDEGIVTYYLPKGAWYGLLDGKIRHGPGYVQESHDFMNLPVLLRPGSAIAISRKQDLISPVYDYANDLKILVNPGDNGVDLTIEIPYSDDDSLGSIKAVVHVTGDKGGIEAKVIQGHLTGSSLLQCIIGEEVKESEFQGTVASI